jgi:SAM-dependent methyltransferase
LRDTSSFARLTPHRHTPSFFAPPSGSGYGRRRARNTPSNEELASTVTSRAATQIYGDRKLAQGHPGLEGSGPEHFIETMRRMPDDRPRIERLLTYLNRLIDVPAGASVCVLGCGPVPQTLKIVLEQGYKAVGIEPVPEFVTNANEYLGSDVVVRGTAERIPLADESLRVMLFENVLEHVDSPVQSMAEIYRVLQPGGVAYVTTTNRYRVSVTGENGEYNVPFFNWLPGLVKESYVFKQLHHAPALAGYSARPAVHWFTYAELCRLGRQAGFAQFYSPLDLRDPSDVPISASWAKRRILGAPWLLRQLQTNAFVRALALTQTGNDIFMLKRA